MRRKTIAESSIVCIAVVTIALQSISAFGQDSLKHHNKMDSVKVEELTRVPAITLNDWRTLDYDTIDLKPSYAFVPLIFSHQTLTTDTIAAWNANGNYALDVDRSWLNDDIRETNKVNQLRYATIASHPDYVIYNLSLIHISEPTRPY